MAHGTSHAAAYSEPASVTQKPMNEPPAVLRTLALLAAAALFPATPVPGQTGGGEGAAAPEPGAARAYDECASPEVVFEEGSEPLTRAERIARMEQALHESLSRFERCRAASSGSGGGAAGGQGGGGVAGGGSDAGGGNGRAGESGESGEGATGAGSVASRSISGTESPSETGVPGADAPETGTAGESGGSAPASGSVASRSVSGTEAAPGTDARGAESETDAQPVSVTYAPDAANASTRPAPDGPDNGKVPDDIPAADNDSVLEAQIRRAAMTETDPEVRAKLWNEYRAYKGLPRVPADR